MSSPTARAEARRKAILSRGGDRLAKLTTSARGEDAPAYFQDGELRRLGLVLDHSRRRRWTCERKCCVRRRGVEHAPSTTPAKGHTETIALATRLRRPTRSKCLVY